MIEHETILTWYVDCNFCCSVMVSTLGWDEAMGGAAEAVRLARSPASCRERALASE